MERSWSEGTVLFTTDKWFPGEQAMRLFFAEGIRVFTTWNSKMNLLCFQTLFPFLGKLASRLETETPPERGLGRGSIRSNWGRASAHPALARKRARVQPHRSYDPSVFRFAMNGAVRIINSLACCSDHRWQRARCMIGDRGEVKARATKFSITRSGDHVEFYGRGCFGW